MCLFKHPCICVLFLIVITACQKSHEPADLLILGGKIYTMNDRVPIAHAVAVKGSKILFAGSEPEARKYFNDNTKVIDLGGKVMTPGFIEGHAHLMEVGYNEMELDLISVKSYEELVTMVKDAVAKVPPGQWIVGRGWHQDKWDHMPEKMVNGFQTHHLLSAVSKENPVFLWHASGHAGLANAKAMEIARVNQLSIENMEANGPADRGEIIRDKQGNPTGIFTEQAMGLIAEHIPANTAASDAQALELALKACARNGLTGFHDAGASASNIALFKQFKDADRLSVRLYVMLSGSQLAHEWLPKGPDVDANHFLTIRSIKLSCDGALGSRGAWLLEPYSDRPDFSGMATTSMDTVLSIARDALKAGFQVCSHAIGDRANREVLNQYETAFQENPEKAKDHRFRIEHAQHLHPDDIPRFAQLGVIAAMQAIHLSSDRPWAIDRLGEKRIREGAYMWQSLLRSGAKIVNGTDAPVEPLNPIPCFYASVSRKTLSGEPRGGFEPEQKMSRQQALRSYTLDAAYGAFQEEVLGSIQAGKYADFTIFSGDIMTMEEEKILDTEVVMTVVGGKVVYEKSKKAAHH
jgi:predicted amidohydrolase YtcJ